ncbi:sensor histidine kinase [Hymenobacter lapidiphilus]|uniref:Sensor histidine kinase n=1 Tax=Hymenobacter lapidiphilus TaxID=2608003 RepID=A0A7Y7PNY3_9BACT|nr:sensor histidine kinase [Hymenobacter lapidiphilus]NVO31326.1 sensor histidine kinase [Hymenobacter lapidiphilus]
MLVWLFYGIYTFIGLFVGGRTPTNQVIWLSGSMLFIRMLEFYLCYLVVYPRRLRSGRGWSLAEALAGVVALFVGLRALIEEVLFPAILGFGNYRLSGSTAYRIGYYIGDNIYFAIPVLVISAAIWATQAALRQEQENQLLRGEKRASEMAFLKTQINPHFLYNTLNMLYGLAYPVSKPLAGALLKLADLMRYMLRDTPDGQVLLSEEIDYLRNYLDLHRLRFAEQFFVDFELAGDPTGLRIAPLLLIPFVENALKHGTLDDSAHPVRIRLALSPGWMQFEVRNQPLAPNDHKDATTGVGLPNLRRRLELLYPGCHTLHVTATEAHFVTSLQLATVGIANHPGSTVAVPNLVPA